MKTMLNITMGIFFVVGSGIFFMAGTGTEAYREGLTLKTVKKDNNQKIIPSAIYGEADLPKSPAEIKKISGDRGANTGNPIVAKTQEKYYYKPDEATLGEKLTPLQYEVTQRGGTERPFQNEYWNNHKEGIYVDIVSGEPLFSSRDKFDSRTGWPSFTRPLEPDNIVEKEDTSIFMKRVEVRSRHGDSHLGHVFDDGPPPTGLRYCMNSAALRFIPKEDLEKEGYGEYLKLFAK